MINSNVFSRKYSAVQMFHFLLSVFSKKKVRILLPFILIVPLCWHVFFCPNLNTFSLCFIGCYNSIVHDNFRCPAAINPTATSTNIRRDGLWYNMSDDQMRMYAYSAIYDDRLSLLSEPVIRVIVISDPVHRWNVRPYCVLRRDDAVTVVRTKEKPKPIGWGWPMNKKAAREYVLTCPTVGGIVPHSVSITSNPNIDEVCSSTITVPVTVPKKPEKKRDFAICMQVSFGHIDPVRIIEWIELQKILGVSLIGIYDLKLSEASLNVLRHYSDEGLVDLRKTEPIYDDLDHYLLQGSPVINDCIYRHMYEFDRIIVIDFDEIILPRKHDTLADLVAYLDEAYPQGVNYAFRNNYFFLDMEPDVEIPPSLTLLRFRRKVTVSPNRSQMKSIINPMACTNMHNHDCWGLTPDYALHTFHFWSPERYGRTQPVDPDVALNQHYKKCHLSKEECRQMMKDATLDDTILQFRNLLTKRVGEKVKTLIGPSI